VGESPRPLPDACAGAHSVSTIRMLVTSRHSLLPDSKRPPHYGALLVVLALLIVVAPLSTGTESEYFVEFFFDLVLVTGVYAAAARKGAPWLFLGLTVVTLAWRWSALLLEGDTTQIGALAITVVWMDRYMLDFGVAT